MVTKHKAHLSGWTKEQDKIITNMKEKHILESQSQQKILDNLRRSNTLLENDNAQCKRDLQSAMHRFSALEKLLTVNDNEHKQALEDVLRRATKAETRLEASQVAEKELKSKVLAMEKNLNVQQEKAKADDLRKEKVVEGLQNKVSSLIEQNKSSSTRIPQLEEEAHKARHQLEKQKQKLAQSTEQTVREANMKCESHRVAKENETIKLREKDDLLKKQATVNQAMLDQLLLEKNEVTTKMEKLLIDERDVARSLMAKVQQLNTKIQTLSAEKLHMQHTATKQSEQICHLENIIANGEVKLSQFGKQLSRSMEDQERRIMKEVELKREMNALRIELERIKRQH